jgi:hypothetical protein
MKKARKMPELILQLKAVKTERNLSNQDIVNLLRAKGYFTSLSSVKRVFQEGSEELAFSYEDTILPLVEVLLVEATPAPVEDLNKLEDAQQYIIQIEGLQADAALKETLIGELTRNNTTLQSTVETQAAAIEKQTKTIEDLTKTRKTYRVATAILVAAFVFLTLMVFAYLIIHDAPNPNYGILPSYFADQTSGFVSQAVQRINL